MAILSIYFKLILFMFSIVMLLYSFILYDTFAKSPSFLRQEIIDNNADVYSLESQSIGPFFVGQSLDILGASYFSDGRFLNTSIWLDGDYLNKNVSYLVIIDSDSDPRTGDHGAEYRIDMNWDSKNQTWKRKLVESISVNDPIRNKAIIDEKEIFGNLTSPVKLDLDLKNINYPASYNLVFYTQTSGTHEDFTDWVRVPAPRLFVSTSENPVELETGEKKRLDIQINSTTGLEPAVNISTLNQNPNITSQYDNDTLRIPSYGATTLPLEINVSSNIKPGQYLFPLFAEVVFPYEAFRPYIVGSSNSQVPFMNTTEQSTLVIKVLEPLKPEQHLKQFVDNWFNPLTGIYQTVAAIIGGISGYIIGKVSKKKDSKEQKNE